MNNRHQKLLFRVVLLMIMALVFANLRSSEASSIRNRSTNFGGIPGALPNFDIRDEIAVNIQPNESQTESLSSKETVSMTWNERYGVPELLINYGDYLTSPSSANSAEIVLEFLRENQTLYGLSQAELNNLVIQKQYQTAHNGATHIVLVQTDNGRSIFGSQIKATIDSQGRIVIIGGPYYPGAATSGTANLSAGDAVSAAVAHAAVEIDTPLEIVNQLDDATQKTTFANTIAQGIVNPSNITAELITFPMPVGYETRLGWQVIAEVDSIGWYKSVIDAQSGELLFRDNFYAADGPEGTVFTDQHPDASGNVRDLVSFEGAPFDGDGWVTDNATAGNNVNAYQDLPNNNTVGYQTTTPASPDPNYQHFNFPFADLWRTNADGNVANAAPDLDATITQLFYYTNVMHDYLYTLGFDEAAGNFQENNFGLGLPDSDSDGVNAEAHDGYDFGCTDDDTGDPIRCVNNAFFGTPPDGENPRMQMYLWVPTRPYRDGSLDGDVVAHEYGHGLSSRLVTGENLCCGPQTASMGEGWSDTVSMYMWGDSIVGEYVTNNTSTGIRNVNYASSPHVYSDFGWVVDVCEQHCNGEIWATVLYDLQEALIDAYGSAGGQALVDQLLVDGMKNTPTSPTFLTGRNGILAADMTNNGGANQCLIWRVFANREMGIFASTTADQMSVTPDTNGPKGCMPNADAGGPYTTNEGVDADLDGTASDPGSDPSAGGLSYAWDLDGDTQYDDAFTDTPTFTMVGQDGVYNIGLQVTNDAGWTDEDATTVTVNNVAPTVTLDPTDPVDENSPITVSGEISDPGWLEDLTATIDWGDGTPVENIDGDLENDPPNATLTFSIDHVYGDNGTFAAELCGHDDDTSTCQKLNLQVNNVNPTATIDLSDAILINGIPTILGSAGEPVDFSGNSTDPGSDDLTLRWDWNDGSPVEETISFVNPNNTPDPFPSPSIEPRDVNVDTSHTFGDACLYQISFWAEDDDGGVSDVDTAYVLIVGTAERARHAGYWQHQYSGHGRLDFDEPTLQCYLDIIGFTSNVFNEEMNASTIPAAFEVLFMGQNGGDARQKLDRQLLTVWLNFANGSMGYLEMFDTDNDGVPDTTLADIMAEAEMVRLDPNSTNGQLRKQVNLLVRLINRANQDN